MELRDGMKFCLSIKPDLGEFRLVLKKRKILEIPKFYLSYLGTVYYDDLAIDDIKQNIANGYWKLVTNEIKP